MGLKATFQKWTVSKIVQKMRFNIPLEIITIIASFCYISVTFVSWKICANLGRTEMQIF